MNKELIKAIIESNPNWKPKEDLESMITVFTTWSTTQGFPNATQYSSLIKLEEEIEEIVWEIFPGSITPKDIAEEYVDAIMCLLDSAKRGGISTEHLVKAFKKKLEINLNRTWKQNPDNTYSHIK